MNGKSATLGLLFLALVILAGCANKNVVGHESLANDENFFIGRVFYLEDRALAKNKTFLQTIGVDEWLVEDITLCFSDASPEKICKKFDEYSIRLEKHKDNQSALLSFKSKAKTIRFTDIHISAAGRTNFHYSLVNPPEIKISEKGSNYYIGDFLLYLKGDADKDKIPQLSMGTFNKIGAVGKSFARETKLDHAVKVKAKPFNLKGTKYRATRTDVVRKVTPVFYFKPR